MAGRKTKLIHLPIAIGTNTEVTMTVIELRKKEFQTWKAKNSDPYSKCCVDFAIAWAGLMEAKISRGAKLEDIAKKTSHEADVKFGITGFMYGAAVQSLAHFWIHGEALRKWHNLETQIGNEGEAANKKGGTLNPAVMNIGKNK